MAKKPKTTAAEAGLTYRGPTTGFEHEAREILLVKGRTYTGLPLDHPIVVNLIAEKLLVEPLVEPEPEAPIDPAPSTGDEF